MSLAQRYQPRYPTSQTYRWALVRLGTKASEKPQVVGRYMNRRDADDSKRLIDRLLRRQDVQFAVVFIGDEA